LTWIFGSDRVFCVYLRGNLPESRKKALAPSDQGLVNATLTVAITRGVEDYVL
jgi:hypothetical protein